jgi:5-methylcytosine-specific restriction endonuclease McrA
MINLPILRRNDRVILSNIVDNKHEPARTCLLNVYDTILGDYLKYYKNRYNLERLTADITINTDASKYLKDAYKSGKEIDSVKAKIMEIMPPAIKEKCPYCMLSEPGTFDHYVGKERFPEYSVLSKNLVPCCSKCNSKKGKKFLAENGKSIFISFYFDDLPQNSFLMVELDIDGDIPYIKNMYTNSNSGKDIDEIIKTHFDELGLFERYMNPMSNKLSLLIAKIEGSKQVRDEISEIIENEITALEKIYGASYWECSLYRAVICNEDIMDYLENIAQK